MSVALARDAQPGPERRHRSPTLLIAGALAGAGLLAILAFDLGVPLAFNDDWQFAWSVRQLLAGHGLHVVPGLDKPVALPQILWAAAITLGHSDPRLLRLSVLPFIAMIIVCTYLLAARLGAGPVWSALAVAVTIGDPLFATNATSFMSDTAYIGLLLAATLFALDWTTRGRNRWLFVALIGLCTLQRQIGIILPAALTASLILTRPPRRGDDWLPLSAAWVVAAAAYVAPGVLGINRPALSVSATSPAQSQGISPLIYAIPMLGLLLAPFAISLLASRRPGHVPARRKRAQQYLGFALAGAATIAGALRGASHDSIFPGNVFTRFGFVPTLAGNKPPLMPTIAFIGVEAIALLTFALLAREAVLRLNLEQAMPAIITVVFAFSQLVPLFALQANIYDRYYLPVAALLTPVVAAAATRARWQRLARGWAIAAVAAGVVFYIAGEQDYQAWQFARNTAARGVYAHVDPLQVDAGYEANAVYGFLPALEKTGITPALEQYLALGPRQPRARLLYAPLDDPRAGVAYGSIASGKIVTLRDRP